jgi:elongation factor Ts
MTEISAAMVKQLRDATSAGMMECKRALQETEGDFDGAVKLLR